MKLSEILQVKSTKHFSIMRQTIGVTDLFVFLLIGVISCTLARPSNEEKRSSIVRQDDSVFELEFRDLFSDASSPGERIANGKKHMKNASGKSDEGGFYKTYGSDADGEKGYVKQTYSNGDHGYKTLDTFHKKDGDNYGFEKHTAFGKERGANKGGRQGKSGTYRTKNNGDEDHEGAGTIVDTYYVEDDGDKAAYKEAEVDGGDASGESSSYTDGGENEHLTADEGGDVEHYTEGGDAGHYTEGGDAGHYTEGGDAGHYTEGGSGSGNYGNSDGYNEHYSRGGGDEGSYGSHGSYTSDGDGDGPYGGEYY